MKLCDTYVRIMRESLQCLCVPDDTPDALKNIVLVGAEPASFDYGFLHLFSEQEQRLYDQRHGHDGQEAMALGAVDQDKLISALQRLHRLSIQVAENFSLSLVNKQKEYGGENFLDGTHKADLVITCDVWGAGKVRSRGAVTVDDRHHVQGIWAKAAKESGAKVIMTIDNYGGSLDAHAFVGEDFPFVKRENQHDTLFAKDYPVPPHLKVGVWTP